MPTDEPPTLGLRQGTLKLVAYDPRWQVLFEQEAARISHALQGVPIDIEHIGSTSVPGLCAKPILDLAMRSDREPSVTVALTRLGYVDRGVRGGRLFVRLRDESTRTHNLHFFGMTDADYKKQLAFRDALRSSKQLRDEYADLKIQLVRSLRDQGRKHYASLKSEFIEMALNGKRH